jgi:uncharacterized membrane protein
MNTEIQNNNKEIESVLHGIFEFGILIKFINGIWETASGFLILFLSKEKLGGFFQFLSNKELLEDPDAIFANFFSNFFQNLTHHTQVLIAVYILIHGLLNLFLSIQLYRDKIWAYLVTISIMMALILYQIHRIILYHSPLLITITVFDFLFVALTWHEYRYKKRLQMV